MTQSSTSVLSDSPELLPQQYEFDDIRVSIERIQALLERGETLLYGEEVQRELFPGGASSNTAVAVRNGKNIYQQQQQQEEELKKKKSQYKQKSLEQQHQQQQHQRQQMHMHRTGGNKGTQRRCSSFHPGMNREKSAMQENILRRKTAHSLTTTPLQQKMTPASTELSRRSPNSALLKSGTHSGKFKRLTRDMHECIDDDDERVDLSVEELFLRIRRELEDYRNNNNNNHNNNSKSNRSIPHKSFTAARV